MPNMRRLYWKTMRAVYWNLYDPIGLLGDALARRALDAMANERRLHERVAELSRAALIKEGMKE